ncbi:MAG: uroporphyrinogen-III synthase [Planctomycetota bacterium]
MTRAPAQAGALVDALRAYGAEPLCFPLLRIESPADPAPLRSALTSLDTFGRVVFTSRNGVEQTWAAAQELGLSLAQWPPVAAVGAGTAEVAADYGLSVDLIPQPADAEGLLALLCAHHAGAAVRMLLPQADNARPLLVDGLRQAGYHVTAVVAYRGLAAEPGDLPPGPIAAVTLASSATVRRFLAAIGRQGLADLQRDGCAWVAIGAHTAETLTAMGLAPVTVASEPTMTSLAAAVMTALAPPSAPAP